MENIILATVILMTSARLVNCIECKKSFSSILPSCPHCGTNYPFGVTCYLCKKNLLASQSVRLRSVLSDRQAKIVHEECLNRVMSSSENDISVTCTVCHQTDTVHFNKSHHTNGNEVDIGGGCSKCGHPRSYKYRIYQCNSCGYPIRRGQEMRLPSKFGKQYIFHSICLNSNRSECLQEVERLEQIEKVNKDKEEASHKEKQLRQNLEIAKIVYIVGCIIGGIHGFITLKDYGSDAFMALIAVPIYGWFCVSVGTFVGLVGGALLCLYMVIYALASAG
ncbi:MAG: hypothetical protein ACKO4S_00895 [Snowella sp.]